MGTLKKFKKFLQRGWYLYICRYTLPEYIVMQVSGGLGNQIWHWACGQAVAAHSSSPVLYELPGYDNGKSMDYNRRESREFNLLKTFPSLEFPVCPSKQATVLRRCTRKNPPDIFTFYEAELHQTAPQWLGGCYWNLDYLRAVPEQVWARLVFSQNIPKRAKDFAGRIDSEPAAVAVHIRRGDYVGDTFYDVLKPAYYYHAIDELKARLAPVEPIFFIFSSDCEWARGIFASRPERFVYADNGNDDAALDMTLMARCRHFIIANSTFSLFAAFLSRKDPNNRIVVAPITPWKNDWTNGLSETEFPRLVKISASG